jgi:hypothetical protein
MLRSVGHLLGTHFPSSFLKGPQISQHVVWVTPCPPPDPEVDCLKAISSVLVAVNQSRGGNVVWIAPKGRSPGVLKVMGKEKLSPSLIYE